MLEYLNSFFQSPIFKGLNVDGSIVIQFAVVIVMWLVLKYLFLNKLREVLIDREEKTIGIEKDAEATLKRVNELNDKYKKEVDAAHMAAQQEFARFREQVVQREELLYKKAENESQIELKKNVEAFTVEFNTKAKTVLAEAEGLSQLLLKKITG